MNEPTDQPIHETTDEARAGTTPHIVRYVLGISLALTIIALSAIWITGAIDAPEETDGGSAVPASEQAQP